uniref:Alpha-soluble NSF attachment protein n=1 Tax=Grammatophora oceanica TaxID=210454 RepID=A0A7S1YCT5_9STRA|mmetsp:Transcript_43726/g.64910  ORF Transcript_43726/g.64910 Transcript_43726/m.64910 type:complete len:312 (+) Transcript_43726:66-1001(+)|eukprot:CAMPEP_0194028584 /NCGR_PEP_ID=MMETSP0009_2-20130614/2513_1 /TAXON_ID=210454 /ORGANISM="Grammatophora oceanica, Strain CCMP 410" /LENGTH=311 /DNA_ID=CAMNT_0038668017 /DNA_START=66 /DNA_END=1001 /DNA_ORIENTATION=+
MSVIARQQKTKAEVFIREAEKTLAKRSWFGSKSQQQEDAAELYDKAGNAYKVGGLYHEAGEAYTQAAQVYADKLSNTFEASKMYQNAGQCFHKSSPADAVNAYNQAILLMTDAGRILPAAKLSKTCAELYEKEGIDLEDKSHVVLAIEAYEQAAELFEAENSPAQKSTCIVKIAELCSAELDPPDLLRAAGLYDSLGRSSLDSNMLKFHAKGYFLQTILCHLANGDSIAGRQAVTRYEALDYTFGTSREGKFAAQLLEAVDSFDGESFASACFEYDKIAKLDPWKTAMLVKVKKSIDGDEEGEEEDDVDLT